MKFFKILNINFQKISFVTFFLIFVLKSILNREVTLIHSKFFTGSFCDIQIICTLIVQIQQFFLFITVFHVFVINFCISTNTVTYSSSNFFFTVNNILISVERPNFTLAFLKLLAMQSKELKETVKSYVSIF